MSSFYLNAQGRDYIGQKLLEDFALSTEQSDHFMQLLETALNGNNEPLFYSIRFEIERTRNVAFSSKVFNTIFTIYTRDSMTSFLEIYIYIFFMIDARSPFRLKNAMRSLKVLLNMYRTVSIRLSRHNS